MKRFYFVFALILTSLSSWAYDVEIDGVCYNLNKSEHTAEVTCKNYNYQSGFVDVYLKDYIKIPNSIVYEQLKYDVTSIGDCAFMGCTGLTSIDISNSVTSIGVGAFFFCTGLKSIDIPNSVTSIGNTAFGGCTGLTSIDFSDSVSSIGIAAFSGCSSLTSIEIPISVMSIGSKAFDECPLLKTIIICSSDIISSNTYSQSFNVSTFFGEQVEKYILSNNITSIGACAFYGCSGMKSIEIPNSVTSIGDLAFSGCSGMKSIEIPKSLTSIGSGAFYNCNGLTSVHISDLSAWCKISFENANANPLAYAMRLFIGSDIEVKDLIVPNEVTSIGRYTFYGCAGLTSVEIPNSVTSIGESAFSGCTGLTSITIPNSVTSIGYLAFSGCTGLTSITIPNSVTHLNGFSGCIGLTSVEIPNSVTSIGGSAFRGCTGLTSIEIPNSVTTIEGSAFYGCTSLTSIEIPNNVTSIGRSTFNNCTSLSLVKIECREVGSWFAGLTSIEEVKLGDNVTKVENNAFKGCTGLVSINIPYGVTSIGGNAFDNCISLSSVKIECKEVGSWFAGLTSIKEVELGENVTLISDNAFNGSSGLTSLALPDEVIYLGRNITQGRILVHNGTKTLLTIWNYNQKNPNDAYSVFNKTDEQELLPPAFNVNPTQTTAIVTFDNVDLNDGFTYTYNNEPLIQTKIKRTALKPDNKYDLSLVVSKDDVSYTITDSYTTKGLSLRIDDQYEVTASSIRAKGAYTEEDAKVVTKRMSINGKVVEGNECFAFGLNPGKRYSVVYEIDVDYGGDSLATYQGIKDIYTTRLQFSVAQPKVVNIGNAIVSATVNLDPEEENVGFEWRRTDWTNEFPSNTGKAYLYDGIIEGYIKNLNTDKLWKFRPYYLSDDGTYHYGDWMGLDPTNTSYFEPTVHTYAKINIEGNTALVRGYALAGTDNIKVQGFKYWKTSGNNAPHRAPNVPANAQTIEAVGQQIITATLAALEYNTTYHYVAFVTTEDGTTYYGEEQVFTTPMPPAGIDDVTVEAPSSVKKKGVYTLTGVKLADDKSELQGLPQGMYIIDGKKVMIK